MIKNLYLIGGPPRAGKSSIAKTLAIQQNHIFISMDDVRGLLKELRPAGISQDLYYDEGMEIEEFYAKYTDPSRVFELEKQQNKIAERGIWAIAEKFYDWENLIVEGIGVTPEFANEIGKKFQTKSVFLAAKNNTILTKRIYENGLWDNENPYPDIYKEKEAIWTELYNSWFIDETKKHSAPLIYIDGLSSDNVVNKVSQVWNL